MPSNLKCKNESANAENTVEKSEFNEFFYFLKKS